jgi:hypothetical protein
VPQTSLLSRTSLQKEEVMKVFASDPTCPEGTLPEEPLAIIKDD